MIRLVGGQPVGQARLEPHAAGLEGGQPDGLERGAQLVRIVFLGAAKDERSCPLGSRLQRPDGRLAVIAEEIDQFVDDLGFVLPAGPGITRPLPGQHFTACFLTHLGVHGSVTPF